MMLFHGRLGLCRACRLGDGWVSSLKFWLFLSIRIGSTLIFCMLIDRRPIVALPSQSHLNTLSTLEVGQSIFCEEWRQAASLRSLSYYLIKTRRPEWKFTFRKMDRGWRLIRVA
jgi:hypothetical protein